MTHRPLLIACIAAGLHFGACLAMQDQLTRPHGESWGWFPIFVIDLPVSIAILKYLQDVPPLLTYGIIGSLWWAMLAFLAVRAVIALNERMRRDAATKSTSD